MLQKEFASLISVGDRASIDILSDLIYKLTAAKAKAKGSEAVIIEGQLRVCEAELDGIQANLVKRLVKSKRRQMGIEF